MSKKSTHKRNAVKRNPDNLSRSALLGKKSAESGNGRLLKARRLEENRHVLIALVMASLVAGLLFLINLDRVTHASASRQKEVGTSFHGWPRVYLERRFESLPAFLRHTRIYDWPYPAVEGEIRHMNYTNLAIDILCGLAVVLLSFLGVRAAVYRYETWKKTW